MIQPLDMLTYSIYRRGLRIAQVWGPAPESFS